MKKLFLPGEKGNALGLVKFYFYDSNGKLSSFGGHTTNSPSSVGKRASHGCFRFYDKDALQFATLILLKDGQTPDEVKKLIKKAKMNRNSSISIKINNGPIAIYKRN